MKRFFIDAALLLGALPFALAQDGTVVTPLPSDAKQAQDKLPPYPHKDSALPASRPTVTYVEPDVFRQHIDTIERADIVRGLIEEEWTHPAGRPRPSQR